MTSAKTFPAALLAFIVIFAGSSAIRAADAPKASPTSAIDRFEANVKSLKLTDDQKPKIDGYFSQAHQDMKSLDAITDAADRDKKSRQISNKLREQVSEVLTNEQKAELVKKMTPTVDTDAVIERIKKSLEKPELKLTADQKTKIDALLDATSKKFTALRAEAKESHTDVRPKIQEVLADMQKQLSAILAEK